MDCRIAPALAKLSVLAALAAGAAHVSATPVQAQTAGPAGCSTEGMDWNNHPLFRASLDTSERDRTIRSVGCRVESVHDLEADGVKVRLTLSQLFVDGSDYPRRNIKRVEVAQVEAAGERRIGSLLLDSDPLNAEMVFAPQVRRADDGIYLRLSPRHRHLYRIADGKLFASLAFGWRDALDGAFPPDARSGDNLGIDLETMEGRIAVRSHAKDPGAPPASAYAGNPVLVAKLALRDGQLRAETTEIMERPRGAEPFLDLINDEDGLIRSGLKSLPEGTEPCLLRAWSNDPDPAGLNVRAAPSAQAKVLGIVPPPRMMPKEEEAFGPGPARSEFRVIGYRDGWFLIDSIKAPGVAYEVPYPRHLPQAYKGRGWVNGRMIGGALAYGGLPPGRLYVSPHADAASSEHLTSDGHLIGAGERVSRIHACSGSWALIETPRNQRGWRRRVCSNQVTNCS